MMLKECIRSYTMEQSLPLLEFPLAKDLEAEFTDPKK